MRTNDNKDVAGGQLSALAGRKLEGHVVELLTWKLD